MQYDPAWEEKDFLKVRSKELNEAESLIITRCKHMVHTPEDLHYYKIECQKARLRKNQEISQMHWLALKARSCR